MKLLVIAWLWPNMGRFKIQGGRNRRGRVEILGGDVFRLARHIFLTADQQVPQSAALHSSKDGLWTAYRCRPSRLERLGRWRIRVGTGRRGEGWRRFVPGSQPPTSHSRVDGRLWPRSETAVGATATHGRNHGDGDCAGDRGRLDNWTL